MSDISATAAPPPTPPRPLTPIARRRAWGDPRVRFWWGAGLVLIAAAAFLLISRTIAWREDSRLSIEGTVVDAKILQAEESVAPGKTVAGDKPVRLSYSFNGKTYEVTAPYLEGRPSEKFLIVGSTIPIRVDPKDPNNWTPRESPAPLGPELIGGAITLGIGVLVVLLGFAFRSRVLRTWRNAKASTAVVLEARHTALSPGSWAVRCSPVEEGDNRVFEVFMRPKADVTEGTAIWILLPESGRPLAASWFE